ncbi:META domain-containing protein [Leptolyngbya sp. 15MV]|nr:META domain-containing protein [Leptolyngbya sp. 15MV]
MKCRLFNGTDNSAKSLAAKRWILKSIGGDKIELSKDLPFLNFDREKMSAGGNGGCNVFGGSFEVKDNSIKFGDMFSTMMACEHENRMSIEQRFFDGLRSADRFEINNGRLILYKGDDPVLEFAAADK